MKPLIRTRSKLSFPLFIVPAMHLPTPIVLLTVALLLAQRPAVAQLGPDYIRPDTETVQWRAPQPLDTHPRGEWWACFHDSGLNALMQDATRHNQSLKAAIARFDQARATARIARGNFFPNLSSGKIFAERQRTSQNMPSPFPLNGLYFDGPAYEVPLDFSWELDLWGKIRRQYQSGVAEAGAAAADIHNVLLGIHSDVATNYFRLRALDSEIGTVVESIQFRREAFDIAAARVKAGAGSEIEEAQAETEVAIAESELASLHNQRDQLKNAIAILVGANASRFDIPSHTGGCPVPPRVPTGLQSDLLERRPDIATAERRLESITAQIGATRGLMFPSIKLVGSGGWQSGDIDYLFESSSLLWRVGPSISFPLFSGGQSRSKMEEVRASHDVALANYRQAFLIAVSEVETSVAALRHLEIQAEAQQRAKTSAARASSLAKTRYEAGTSPYLEVIDSNRALLNTHRGVEQLAGQRLIATVSLIKALGGGWDQRLPVEIPNAEPDPASQTEAAEQKKGFFKRIGGLFRKKDKAE